MKLSEKNWARVWVIFAGLFIVLPFWIYETHTLEKKIKIQFEVFNSSNLSGRISYLYGSQGGVRFQLNGTAETYLFIPRMTPRNGYADFAMVAETEDSVYKPAFADTLILIKVITKKRFKFTFDAPD
jgi:hypothetical protein